jgi:hypothetical protein
MARRFIASFALALAIAVTSLVTPVVLAQTGAAAKPALRAPRAPDGRPDLQGNWSFATITPLERPAMSITLFLGSSPK